MEPTKGEVVVDEKSRMSVLKQDHFAYEQYTVFETILQGNPRLYEVLTEKDPLYEKRKILARRTASAPPIWRLNLPNWAAGTPRPKQASCCRVWGLIT